jgi:5-oxoprolinase (ATP-hydrolysing)
LNTRWQFWVDRGGTFTDIVACAPDGRLIQKKLLSDAPEHYQDAAIAGIRSLLGLSVDAAIPDAIIAAVKMGTTVGTNALLTHSGEPVVLITTAGFSDALEIGDQARPDIFALDIRKPSPLHHCVIEATERIGVDGTVLQRLETNSLNHDLAAARADGYSACAIALLHSWKNPAHELAVGTLARAAGFSQISLSHQASPLIKFVPRAETAVLDATLSPPVRRYADQITAALPTDAVLEFMQSNGGLVAAEGFQGKDSVLSGPAGGLIGMAKVGQAAGFDKLIGFDMGGTSTDVSLFSGQFERSLDSRIAGHRIRVPMLGVHTVAAGGGSILHFDGERLQTGPASAGNLPGPTCYRRGGPLTVTDANLLLGRLQTDFFPAVFGPQGDQHLDIASVRVGFAQQATRLNAVLNLAYRPEQLAAGYLDIAIEHMANAIRHITLARGVNPADFTLVSFGGAGGQHACAVASRLGIRQVLISPYASVLSAYGIGLAERREVCQIAVEQPFNEACLAHFACSNLTNTVYRGLLRYAGADTALAIPLGNLAEMTAAFHAEHRARFGFCDPARELICVALESETVSGGGMPQACVDLPITPAIPMTTRQVYFDTGWRDAPVFQREQLAIGQKLSGPALIVEAGSTLVLEPGWWVTLSARGDLVLHAETANPRRPDPTRSDPTWLTLFNRRFMSIAEDMGRALQNSARSVNIRERLDFSCALFDATGNLIANAPHIPVHLGSMGDSVRAILQAFGEQLRPGDAWLINSPYAGGTHLPDITVVSPIFVDDAAYGLANSRRTLRYFTASRAHHADVGGISPGSMPANSRHIDEEGCRSDGLLIVREGRLLEADIHNWLVSNQYPARNPDQNLADLAAQVAANALGERQLRQLEAEVGAESVLAYMGFVQDNAETAVQRLLTKLRAGAFTLPLDDGSQIALRIEIDPAAQRARIDFTGSSPQQASNLNAPASIAHSAVLYVFRTLIDADIPLNAGVLRPLEIFLPAGSLLNPVYPAAVVAGNVETSQNIVDALYGALGMLAASQGSMNNFSFGDGRHQYYETVCGGTGAGPGFKGASAVHSHMTNSRLTDPEIMEFNYPVRLERFGIRRGSGGKGRFSGGDGVERRIRFLAPMQANLLALRRQVAPFGVAGGEAGMTGKQRIERADGQVQVLPGIAEFRLECGDVFVLETPGGGGFGPPEEPRQSAAQSPA